MADFEWSKHYSVGNAIIDRQHQDFLALCRKAALYASRAWEGTDENFHDVLHEMSQLAELHFKTEEAILESNGYPHANDHAAGHQQYLNSVIRYLFSINPDQLRKQEVRLILEEQWLRHILQSDMECKQYFSDLSAVNE